MGKTSSSKPRLASRIFWDLARAACEHCCKGEFPLIRLKFNKWTHPDYGRCGGSRFHLGNQEGVDPFKAKLVISKLHIWRPGTLVAIIKLADKQYWNDKETTLSDTEYDRVVERLKRIAPDHPQLSVIGTG